MLWSWLASAVRIKSAGYALGAVSLVCLLSLAADRLLFAAPPTVSQSDDADTPAGVVGSRARSMAVTRVQGESDVDSPTVQFRAAGSPAPVGQADVAPKSEAVEAPAYDDESRTSLWTDAISKLADVLPFTGRKGGGASGLPAGAAPSTPSVSATPTTSSSGGAGASVQEVFFSTNEGTACHSSERRFLLYNVPDLYVCAQFAGISGKHVAKVTFVLPDGNVYQTMTVPFMTADTPPGDPMMEVEGRQLEAKPAGWGANGVSMVTVLLPVSGTFIAQHAMAGLWTVRVALDDDTATNEGFFDFLLD
jgi:hypothetical protein